MGIQCSNSQNLHSVCSNYFKVFSSFLSMLYSVSIPLITNSASLFRLIQSLNLLMLKFPRRALECLISCGFFQYSDFSDLLLISFLSAMCSYWFHKITALEMMSSLFFANFSAISLHSTSIYSEIHRRGIFNKSFIVRKIYLKKFGSSSKHTIGIRLSVVERNRFNKGNIFPMTAFQSKYIFKIAVTTV